MTNEEKAKEIAEKNGKIKMYLHGFEIEGALFDALPECYNSAMEMAEWKEQEMIEKTCKWLEGIADSTGYDSYDVIESYKKAMEE